MFVKCLHFYQDESYGLLERRLHHPGRHSDPKHIDQAVTKRTAKRQAGNLCHIWFTDPVCGGYQGNMRGVSVLDLAALDSSVFLGFFYCLTCS